MRRAEIPLIVIILVLALAVRLAALTADPPGWLSWSAGIYSDEGIYSNDARMQVVDNQREPGNFQGAVVAPLQYQLLLEVFRKFGVSLRTVRLVAVVFSMGTLALFWLALRLSHGRAIALAGLVLLSFSAPFVLYNRLGLLEMPALFWLTAGFLCLALAGRAAAGGWQIAALLAAGLLAGLAVSWKATFLLGAVGLIAAAAWRYRARSIAAICGLAVSLGWYALVCFLPHRAQISRAARYYAERQYLPHSIAGVGHDIVRGIITGAGDGVMPYLLKFAPVLLLFALCALVTASRARSDMWLWLWAAVPLVACLFLNYTPSRYFLIFWPALAGLAACALVRLPRNTTASAIALAVCVGLDGVLLVSAYRLRTYTLSNDAAILAASLPHDAWLAGQFAPALCLGNHVRALYVQRDLANDEPGVLSTLPITHVLATRVASAKDDPWAGRYGELIPSPGGLTALPVGRRFVVDLYANKEALP